MVTSFNRLIKNTVWPFLTSCLCHNYVKVTLIVIASMLMLAYCTLLASHPQNTLKQQANAKLTHSSGYIDNVCNVLNILKSYVRLYLVN